MSGSDSNKKYKRPKQKTLSTTNPETSVLFQIKPRNNNAPYVTHENSGPLCPLLAKDSEWVDILQSPLIDGPSSSSASSADEEAVLQLVECEDGPQMRPLAIMFPDLLEKDPQTLQGVLDRAMSTTEVTRHLVDLGQKANFTFMKKSNRLIPKDKQWLESLIENSDSQSSKESDLLTSGISSDYEEDNEIAGNYDNKKPVAKKRRRKGMHRYSGTENINSEDTSLSAKDITENHYLKKE